MLTLDIYPWDISWTKTHSYIYVSCPWFGLNIQIGLLYPSFDDLVCLFEATHVDFTLEQGGLEKWHKDNVDLYHIFD